MSIDEALKMIRNGCVSEWNSYRISNPAWLPDLSGQDLSGLDLAPIGKVPFDLSGASLLGTRFPEIVENVSRPGAPIRLQGALVDSSTWFPHGFDPVAHGARVVSADLMARSAVGRLVFISYAWSDSDVVCAIEQWLRGRRIQTRIDRRDFSPGSRIRDEIVRVMTACDVVLIMYSAAAAASTKVWPAFERELVADMEVEAKANGKSAPRIIYVVLDAVPLPSIVERSRLAINASTRLFAEVCEEIHSAILQVPSDMPNVDLRKWDGYRFP
ncbi:MAG: toll/interleukin-1 receptor domain-containing protein [Dehalococcoidia bacterium]|nr:toll/interleukin-1 receptor domain-containing protein [Dehalococcoidia bacterium]